MKIRPRVVARELPPRTRRIQKKGDGPAGGGGTTSAHAENTPGVLVIVCLMRNYLRARGEYLTKLSIELAKWELPPRTRRIPHNLAILAFQAGTTSAHAENTMFLKIAQSCAGNYLRARGEYPTTLCRKPGRKELPPRTRRIPSKYLLQWRETGTTSAHAENTGTGYVITDTAGNYLRARGEYFFAGDAEGGTWELPPRTRRIQKFLPVHHVGGGTTSAHAENTFTSTICCAWSGNYLRARGEYVGSQVG